MAHFLNFAVILTPSCEQTFREGLNLTCSSSQGLNFEDFPFFYFLNRTSRSRVSPIQRFTTQQISQMSPISYKSLNGATSASRSSIEEVKKGKSSKFNPRDDEQVKSSPSLKVWSDDGVKITAKFEKWVKLRVQ